MIDPLQLTSLLPARYLFGLSGCIALLTFVYYIYTEFNKWEYRRKAAAYGFRKRQHRQTLAQQPMKSQANLYSNNLTNATLLSPLKQHGIEPTVEKKVGIYQRPIKAGLAVASPFSGPKRAADVIQPIYTPVVQTMFALSPTAEPKTNALSSPFFSRGTQVRNSAPFTPSPLHAFSPVSKDSPAAPVSFRSFDPVVSEIPHTPQAFSHRYDDLQSLAQKKSPFYSHESRVEPDIEHVASTDNRNVSLLRGKFQDIQNVQMKTQKKSKKRLVLEDDSYQLNEPNTSTPQGTKTCTTRVLKKLRKTTPRKCEVPLKKLPEPLHEMDGASNSTPNGKRKVFAIMDDDEDSYIPESMRPEDGWITPQSRRLGKRTRFTEEDKIQASTIIEKAAYKSYASPRIVRSTRVNLIPSPSYDPKKYLRRPKAVLRKPMDDDMIDALTVKKLKEAQGAEAPKHVSFEVAEAAITKHSIVVQEGAVLEASLMAAQKSGKMHAERSAEAEDAQGTDGGLIGTDDSETKKNCISAVEQAAPFASASLFGQAPAAALLGQPATAIPADRQLATAPTTTFGQPSISTAAKPLFGQPATAIPAVGQLATAPAITFGQPANTTAAKLLFGQPTTAISTVGEPTTAPAITFGQPANTTAAKLLFGQPTTAISTGGEPTTAPTTTFGQPANTAAAKLLFGQPTTAISTGGEPTTAPTTTFGQPTNSTAAKPLFGQPAIAIPPVGQTTTSTPATLFGQPANTTPAAGQPVAAQSLFGQPATAIPTAAPTTTFGQPANTSAAQPLFGQPATAIPSIGQTTTSLPAALFGQPANTTPMAGQSVAAQSVFGQPAIAIPAVGQPTAAPTTMFGQPANTSAAQPLFGQPATTNLAFEQPAKLNAGQPTSTPGFGKPASTAPAFGQPAIATSMFGQVSNNSVPSFGQAPVTATPSFGQAPISNAPSNFHQTFNAKPPLFGGQAASTPPLFEQGNSAGTMFGQASNSTPNDFGKLSATTGFNQTPTATSFGARNPPAFGDSTSNSSFAKPSTSSSFAAPSQSTFQFGAVGANNSSNPAFGSSPSPFGQQSTGFGQSQQPPAFGQAPAASPNVFAGGFQQPAAQAFGAQNPNIPFGFQPTTPTQGFNQAQTPPQFGFQSAAPSPTSSTFGQPQQPSFQQGQSAPSEGGFSFQAPGSATPVFQQVPGGAQRVVAQPKTRLRRGDTMRGKRR